MPDDAIRLTLPPDADLAAVASVAVRGGGAPGRAVRARRSIGCGAAVVEAFTAPDGDTTGDPIVLVLHPDRGHLRIEVAARRRSSDGVSGRWSRSRRRGCRRRARRPPTTRTRATACTTSWAMRSPRRTVYGSVGIEVHEQHLQLVAVAAVDQPGRVQAGDRRGAAPARCGAARTRRSPRAARRRCRSARAPGRRRARAWRPRGRAGRGRRRRRARTPGSGRSGSSRTTGRRGRRTSVDGAVRRLSYPHR